MPKVTNLRNLVKAAIGALTVLPVCASCVYDSYLDTPADDDTGASVNIGITLRTGSMATTRSDVYEPGTDYENYIDFSGGDFRIYFFTDDVDKGGNDTYIAAFTPTSVWTRSGNGYTDYVMHGSVPEEVITLSDFKIMVLANWGDEAFAQADKYVDTDTTIDEVCDADWAQFSLLDNFTLDEEHLIPFYGIHEYKGITFSEGVTGMVELEEPITLLRAMAKVEVVMETSGYSFSGVSIYGYNNKGYCAPHGVYSQDDYGDDTGWHENYGAGLHLVNNGANDDNSTSNKISFAKVSSTDWVAYLPEYSNTTGDDYAYISVTISGVTSFLYFSEYTDGDTDKDDESIRFDIERNTLYRFKVTKSLGYSNGVGNGWF